MAPAGANRPLGAGLVVKMKVQLAGVAGVAIEVFERCARRVWLVGSEELSVEAGQDLGTEGPAHDSIVGDEFVKDRTYASLDFWVLCRGHDGLNFAIENLFET